VTKGSYGSYCPACGFRFRLLAVSINDSFACPQCASTVHIIDIYKGVLHGIMILVTLYVAYDLAHGFWSFIAIVLLLVLLGGSPISILAMWLVPPKLVKGDGDHTVTRLHLS
jgi:hypothetical protein